MPDTVTEELVKRSPLRILERSISGGLGKGNIGVLASRKGVGKTACLVHIATDKLLQGKHVIHVSYSSRVDHIITWYEDIYKEIAKKPRMKAALGIFEEIIRNRVIMNFNQDGTRTGQVLKSIEAMIIQGQFAAETLIVDGFDFPPACAEDLAQFKSFAQGLGLEVWFSASLRGEEPLFDDRGFPFLFKGCLDVIDVLICLRHHGDYVHFGLVKDRGRPIPKDLRLRLDPTTLLIAREEPRKRSG